MELRPLATLPASGRIAVDSAPIIYVLEDHPEFAERYLPLFEGADTQHYEIVISTVTLAEVLTGPLQSGSVQLAEIYRQTLTQAQSWLCVDVTSDIAFRAARIRADSRLKLPDAVQLATAVSTQCIGLVTHDRDFRDTQALPVYR